MLVINEINSDNKARDEFFAKLDPNAPLCMVNLIRFKDKAEYPDGRDTDLTGAEAYNIDGQAGMQMIMDLGGTHVHGGMITGLMLGQVEELWDVVGIVEYPSPAAFRAMLDSEAYQEIHIHREAGPAGQLNIATTSPRHAR